jgi:hypothetical protein
LRQLCVAVRNDISLTDKFGPLFCGLLP